MRVPRALPVLAPSIAVVLCAAPAAAQDMTNEELLRTFQAQLGAFQAAAEGDLGATRRLTLVTVDDLETTPDLAPTVAGAPPSPPAPDALAQGEVAPVSASAAYEAIVAPAEVPPPVAGAPDEDSAAAVASAERPQPGPDVLARDPDTPALVAGREVEPPTTPGTADGVPATAGVELVLASGDDDPDLGAAAETATPTPVVYGVLPPELQVNVRVTFAYDSAVIGEDQLPRLEQLCTVMRGSAISLFRIVGHTDAAGSDLYNERLSLLRGQEVRRWFVDSCGMPASSLEAVGLGERFLFDASNPEAAENRRVEFQALS